MSKQFAMIICESPDGINEHLAVSLDKVDYVTKICHQIFGREVEHKRA